MMMMMMTSTPSPPTMTQKIELLMRQDQQSTDFTPTFLAEASTICAVGAKLVLQANMQRTCVLQLRLLLLLLLLLRVHIEDVWMGAAEGR